MRFLLFATEDPGINEPPTPEMMAELGKLTEEPSLKGYHLLPSARGDLLSKLGRSVEAREEFERAASLTRNGRERELLLDRAAACSRGASSG